jgi:site-specific recombinase XerD
MAGFTPSGKFHGTRHSFGSHLFAVGASSPDVRDLMGHADITTTNIYAHTVDDAAEIMGRLEQMGKHANPRKQAEGQEGKIQEA